MFLKRTIRSVARLPIRRFSDIRKSTVTSPFLSSSLMDMSFPNFILQGFTKDNLIDTVALQNGVNGEKRTYGQLYSHSYSLASELRSKYNIKKGDCVAVLSPNDIDYFTCFTGISLTGACSSNINPLYTEEEVTFQCENTNAKMLITHVACLKIASKVAAKRGIPLVVTGLNAPVAEGAEAPSKEGLTAIESLLDSPIDTIDTASFGLSKPTDVLTIPFSSGTTGRSKGVVLTHNNVVANLLQCICYEGDYMRTADPNPTPLTAIPMDVHENPGRLLVPLPFFHIYGLVAGLFLPTMMKARSIFMPAFDMLQFLTIIQKEKVTRAHVVPPIVLALAKHPVIDKFDLSSCKGFMSGAAPLGAEIQKACETRLNCVVKQAWGMTELSPAATIMPDQWLREKGSDFCGGSVGLLLPSTEAKIVDPDTGKDLPSTTEGELLIRGPQVMKGYHANKEATDAIFDLGDGWMHTGDVAKFDEHGQLFITDRCKELIKYKGFQVAPAELEALLLTHPGVNDVVVIPVYNEEAGEVPRAYVVRKPDTDEVSEEDLCALVMEKLAPHKKLRGGVVFTDVVPKSASGKILRRLVVADDKAKFPNGTK